MKQKNVSTSYLNLKHTLVILLIQMGYALNIGYAQEKIYYFSIKGSINADSGIVELTAACDSSYYPNSIYAKAPVKNGKFTLTGSLPYPLAVEARYNGMVSGLFLVDKGLQNLSLDVDQFRNAPLIDNEVMKDYYYDYQESYKLLKTEMDQFYKGWDSLRNVYKEKLPKELELNLRQSQNKYYQQSDSLLASFIATHPNSYLGLWKLVQIASFSGYESTFDTAFASLHSKLRNTYTGKQLSNKLATGRALVPGKEFPVINCLSVEGHPLTSLPKSKYTLIDFWYSNCSPCISQFPRLDSLYKQFGYRGFQIIGISTDKRRYQANWKEAIMRYKLAWSQYWDIDGAEASKYSINAFPTNFILNDKKQIIRKNISLIELEQLLLENLK